MSDLTRHLSPEQLRRYRQRRLPPAELLEVGDHLETCPRCRDAAVATEDLEAAYHSFQPEPEEHLTYEQLSAYVDGELKDPELGRARSHLTACASCRTASNDLRVVQAEIEQEASEAASLERPRRRATWLLWLLAPTAAGALAAAVFLTLHVSTLQRRLHQEQARAGALTELEQRAASLESRKNNLEQENRRLATRLPALQRDAETLRKHNEALQRQLQLARTASPEQVIRDGSATIILGPDGSPVRVKETEPLPQFASAALQSGALPLPEDLGELLPPAEITRGGGARFGVRGPAGTRVLDPRPTLQWDSVPKADRYEVVFREKTEGSSPAEYNAGPQTSWTPPEPLRRGARYEWQVRAYAGDELLGTAPQAPDPGAVFQVLTTEQAAELQRQLSAAAESPLQRAAAYARAGLLDEAERELRKVSRDNPGSARVARLLEQLQTRRKPRKPSP
jgi:anti-sigma factor RsiW